MKYLLAFFVCVLLGNSVALADVETDVYIGTSSGSVAGVVGACSAVHSNGAPVTTVDCSGNVGVNSITCASSPCGSGANLVPLSTANSPGIPGIGSGHLLNKAYTGFTMTGPLGMTVGHISVECASYNPTDAGGNSQYNALTSTGLGGATVNFGIVNGTHSGTAPLALGSVVMPDSPQAGPWVTSVTTAVATPYTILAGDAFAVTVTNTSVGPLQWDTNCIPMVGP